jgi:hypothetical protein
MNLTAGALEILVTGFSLPVAGYEFKFGLFLLQFIEALMRFDEIYFPWGL